MPLVKPFPLTQQTSSPSYLLLASLDGARATLAARNAADTDLTGQRFQQALRALHQRVPSVHPSETEDQQLRDPLQMLACVIHAMKTEGLLQMPIPEAQFEGAWTISCHAHCSRVA